jgi:hypothetical protein
MYIWKELTQHTLAYAVLLLILGASIFAYLNWSETALHQQIIIAAVSVSYFLWGVVTHLKTDQITKGVVMEYAAISLLGGLLLLLLTF